MPAPLPTQCHEAIVKLVLSGDSVTLKYNDQQESTVTLAYLSAPRLSSAKKNTLDEPYAYDAREVLRRLLVGKEVAVRVEYTVPQINRQFCSVYIKSPKTNEFVNVCIIALQLGFVKLRDEHQRNAVPDEFPLLLEAQRRAKESNVGLWSNASPPSIETIHTLPNPTSFMQKYKGKVLKAIVEHVRDGYTARMRILPFDQLDKHFMVWIQISGIKVPTLKPDTNIEPYAEEAKLYFETRLLQREVELVIEDVQSGTNSMGILLATIKHPAGNIAHFLLREGLAKVHDWTISCVTNGVKELRTNENIAKQQGLRLWAGHVDSASSSGPGSNKKFMALVIRILSPEMILVKSLAPSTLNQEMKLTLTSIRGPKREGLQEGWHHAAREFLRSLAIGKHVTVYIDFERPAQDGYDARTYASMIISPSPGVSQNLALELVTNGYAYVSRPRRGEDDNKAMHIDQLVVAESKAIQDQIGIHSSKPAPVQPRYNDVSESAVKAKQFLPFMQRAKRVNGIVEHVVNGSRLRVNVIKESAKMTIVVAGIRVPSRGEDGADLALASTVELAMQRDIAFEVDAVDKTGAFIATVWVPDEAGKLLNLGVLLLERGRAYIHEYSANQSATSADLYAAELRGKNSKVGLWTNYDSDMDDAVKQVSASNEEDLELVEHTEVKKQLMHVCISEYISGNHFYLQKMSTEAVNNLESLMAKFKQVHHAPQAATAYQVSGNLHVGQLVSAKFSADCQWYRARVRKVTKSEIHVFYLDYGNSEIVAMDSIRLMPAEFVSNPPPQAQEAKLSYIKCRPVDQEYGQECLDRVRELTEGKKLIANLDKVVSGCVYVSLFDPETAKQLPESPIGLDFRTSVNVDLILDGLSVLDPAFATTTSNSGSTGPRHIVNRSVGPAPPAEFAEIILSTMHEAKLAHSGIWEYGDVDEESL